LITNDSDVQQEFKALDAINNNIDDIYNQLKQAVGVEQTVLFKLQWDVYADAFQDYAISVKLKQWLSRHKHVEI